MCKLCYDAMDKSTLLVQLKDALQKKDFEKWNSTSVSFMLLALTDETNCKETHNVAKDLLFAFHEWSSPKIWNNNRDEIIENYIIILNVFILYFVVYFSFIIYF